MGPEVDERVILALESLVAKRMTMPRGEERRRIEIAGRRKQ